MTDTKIHDVEMAPAREMREYNVAETFGVKAKADFKIMGFVSPGPLTPAIDPHYSFDLELLLAYLLALQTGENTYACGHSGTGKTTFFEQVAARLNYNFFPVNFDGSIRASDLLGAVRVREGETYFAHGVIPDAFRLAGTILVLDEVDACPPEAAFSLQRAVSESRKFLIRETGEVFSPIHGWHQ